jgi:hypothetical protein
VRNYFGQKTALYFVFLGFMAKSLLTPAFCSIAIFLPIFILYDPAVEGAGGAGAGWIPNNHTANLTDSYHSPSGHYQQPAALVASWEALRGRLAQTFSRSPAVPVYCMVVLLWAPFVLEGWKRRAHRFGIR